MNKQEVIKILNEKYKDNIIGKNRWYFHISQESEMLKDIEFYNNMIPTAYVMDDIDNFNIYRNEYPNGSTNFEYMLVEKQITTAGKNYIDAIYSGYLSWANHPMHFEIRIDNFGYEYIEKVNKVAN